MIIYHSTKEKFSSDILTNDIDNIIQHALVERTGKRVGEAELNSFRNSLCYMDKILHDGEIPSDCGISLKHQSGLTSLSAVLTVMWTRSLLSS